MENCIFCQIAQKQKENLVYETETVAAFKDINPKAPLHLLIVPKKHIESIKDLQEEDKLFMADLIFAAKSIAEERNLPGYKLQFNVGREGGQVVDHIHLHLLANQA